MQITSSIGSLESRSYDTILDVNAEILSEGSPFALEERLIQGQMLRTWQHGISDLRSLVEIGKSHGNKEFLVYEDERVTYHQWHKAVAHLSQYFQTLGVQKGDRIALAMRNLPEWTVVFFAAASIGAICVPLNAWWTGKELAYGLKDSGSQILICDKERYQRVSSEGKAMAQLDHLLITRADAELNVTALEDIIGLPKAYGDLADIDLPESTDIHPEIPATILYTSGTTGFPKGAVNSHRNLTCHVMTTAYFTARAITLRGEAMPENPPPPVLLIVIPLFHVTGCAAGMMGAIAAGGKIVMMHRWEARQALQLIEREKVTFTGGVPTIAWELIDHPERGNYDLSSLMAVGYGGAPAAEELAKHVKNRLGAMPGNGWGMTETSGTVLSHTAEEYLRNPTSCGVPVPVADAKIMAEDGGTEVPVGGIGELWVKGPMVAQGYWQNEAATAATFVDGWVRTGDLAKRDADGYFYIVDRLKDMILRGGENIYTAEVENALFAHPNIVDASVVGLPHRTLGEEPVAAVTLANGAKATEEELKQWTREHLAAFKCPVQIIIHPTRLPRNANGKIMKDQVRPLFADRTKDNDKQLG